MGAVNKKYTSTCSLSYKVIIWPNHHEYKVTIIKSDRMLVAGFHSEFINDIVCIQPVSSSYCEVGVECQSFYISQWDTTSGVPGRKTPVYESVLWGAVILPDPWPEERLGGEPHQELQAAQTCHRSAQLSGEEQCLGHVSASELYWDQEPVSQSILN